MIALRFDLAAPTRQTAVFFFIFKTSVNRRIYFFALHFLTIMGSPVDIELLSLKLLEVETIDASKISLKCS